jgi:hypothetical protein
MRARPDLLASGRGEFQLSEALLPAGIGKEALALWPACRALLGVPAMLAGMKARDGLAGPW